MRLRLRCGRPLDLHKCRNRMMKKNMMELHGRIDLNDEEVIEHHRKTKGRGRRRKRVEMRYE